MDKSQARGAAYLDSLASKAKKPYLTTSPTIINGAELLDTVHTFIKRFVAFPSCLY